MPLLELLIQQAQNVAYYPPPDKVQILDYSEDEVFEAMLHRMLQDPMIVYGMITGCKKYVAIKLLVKKLLTRYVAKYQRTNTDHCKSASSTLNHN